MQHILDAFFQPDSVALIGASDRPQRIGSRLLQNLLAGGFRGPVWPVNPKYAEVAGRRCYARVADLPGAPSLAVICTPASTVPGLIEALGARGTRAALVLSAGMSAAAGEAGLKLRQAMLEAASRGGVRILGPNCVGLLSPSVGLNASFAPTDALPGPLALVSQSGALTTALLDWAKAEQIGFSKVVSLGDGADLDFADLLRGLADDPTTQGILLYIESIKDGASFLGAARAAALRKPVVVLKAGRAPAGSRAAASHTGALTGSDQVFDAVVRRSGMVRVDTLQALFTAAQSLARARAFGEGPTSASASASASAGVSASAGERLAILTNGGGAGVLAADHLVVQGGRLAEPLPATWQRLEACLPATWVRGNPVDIIGDAPIARYVDALREVLLDPGVEALLFMHAPTAIVPAEGIVQACLPLLQCAAMPVHACLLGGASVEAARRLLAAGGIPVHSTPEQAVEGCLLSMRRAQALARIARPSQRDPSIEPRLDRALITAELQAVERQSRVQLTQAEATRVLAACGIAVVRTEIARDADEAADVAGRLGFPVALKILSEQITHKSDVQGVALDLADAGAVRAAATAMAQRVRALRPDATLLGFTVQQFVRRPGAIELIVGSSRDPQFGPVILFGQGGVAVEVLRDRAVALAPLDAVDADDLVSRTRVAALLKGYRDRPAVDQPALREVLLRVSQLVSMFDQIAELDINPLLADERGVLALDARITLRGRPT